MCFSKFQGSKNRSPAKTTKGESQWNHTHPSRGSRSKQGWTQSERSFEGGFTTLGATLLILTFALGAGSFVILHQIGDKVKTQIELDQLTGKIGIQLRASIITMEESKERLKIARAAMMAGCIYPASCPAFIRAFSLQSKVENYIQKMAEENWNEQKLNWLIFKPILSQKNNFPDLKNISTHHSVVLKIQLGSLISSSKIWKTEGSNYHEWKIAWIE